MENNTRPKALEKISESASTERARTTSARQPISLRLAPNLEEELRREAKKTGLTLRDHIRALLEQRLKRPVAVEESGAGYIKALSEKLEKITQAPLIELTNRVLAELRKLQPQSDSKVPEQISRRVCDAVGDHFKEARNEATRRAKELSDSLLQTVQVTPQMWLRDGAILLILAISCSILSSLAAVCLIHDVAPWNMSEIRTRLVRGEMFESVFGKLPREVQEGIGQYFATGQYPRPKESNPKEGNGNVKH